MATKRTLYTAAKDVLAAYDTGDSDVLGGAIDRLADAITSEHRASAERVLKHRLAKMTATQRAEAIARHESHLAILREIEGMGG